MRTHFRNTTSMALAMLALVGVAGNLFAAPTSDVISRSAKQGPVDVTVTLAKSNAQIAEPVELTVSVKAPNNVAITLPQNQKMLGTLNVLKSSDVSDVPTADGRQWERTYQIESLVPGEHTIPPISIAYTDRREPAATTETLQTPEIALNVVSVLEGEPDPLQFRDVKDVVSMAPEQTDSLAWVGWSVGSAATLVWAAVALLVWPGRTRQLTPKQWALKQLEQLRDSEVMSEGDTEQFYVRLTDIVRQYIERQFAIAAPILTTDEFLAEATQHPSLQEEQRASLRVFLSLADLVKFAQFQPSAEDAGMAIDKATDFIQQSANQADAATTNKETN